MLLSIYTCVRNGIYYDFHVVEMLKHHLPLADEIVVHEGYSDDGTYEAIAGLDPKIRGLATSGSYCYPPALSIKVDTISLIALLRQI